MIRDKFDIKINVGGERYIIKDVKIEIGGEEIYGKKSINKNDKFKTGKNLVARITVRIPLFQRLLLRAKLFKVMVKFWLEDIIKLLWHGEKYK